MPKFDIHDFLKKNEDFKNKTYVDTVGIPTIGEGLALIIKNNVSKKWEIRSDLEEKLQNQVTAYLIFQ